MAIAGCGTAEKPVPRATAQPALSATGCAAEYVDRVRISRRAVAKPRGLLTPFAARAGTLPGDGPALVGGVALPAGSRCGSHWATDAPAPDAIDLARRLAAAFPETGLWPLLWWTSGDPDSYLFTGSEPSRADGLNVHDVLESLWTRPLPPLARGTKGAPPRDPFGPFSGPSVLILVPVNRPADVASVLGATESELVADAQATAVLRSWEARFGAIVTRVGPGVIDLTVGSPPTNLRDARRLEREHAAFAQDTEPQLARDLLTRDLWGFGWPD